MLELAQWRERFYTENGRYDQDRAGNALADVVPASLLSSPKEGGVTYYNFTIGNLAQLTYTITATPATAQVGDKCGNLSLTHAGVKGTTGTATVAQCW